MRAGSFTESKIRLVVVAALATLTACAPLATVRETKPKLPAQHGTLAEQAISDGLKFEQSDPARAIGYYISGLQSSSAELQLGSKDPLVVVSDYDFALARIFSVIHRAHLDPWTHPLQVPSPNGASYRFTAAPSSDRRWNPAYFDLIPADELDVRGTLVRQRVTRDGVGAALVAVGTTDVATIPQRFLPPRGYLAVTAVAQVTGRKCEIRFFDPLATETAIVSGRRLQLHADFTAPMALVLTREHPEKIGFAAMMNPEKFAGRERLIQVQPYVRTKVPVVFVHGLQDTPASWIPMASALWADPILRQNYQVWVFGYPSGYPVPYSAMLLRRELNLLRRDFPDHRRIVLVGHSMGGLLAQLMISDSRGDKLWRYFFGKSPSETSLSPDSKALAREALIFKPQPDVARVIFISTPHRGSMIAENPIGRLASSLLHKPVAFLKSGPEILQAAVVQQEDPSVLKLKRMPNSIDTLSPNDAFVKAMNNLPTAKGVPYHSIIGDRGRGDTPNSSDGVVPYWSSHLEGAASEKIVPSSHNAERNSQGIAEVLRLLKLHLSSLSR